MKSYKNKAIIFSVVLGLLAGGFSYGRAQTNFPSRLIDVVIPLAPGGGNDTVFLPFKERVGKILGQPLVVSYKPGAAGVIGTAFVAHSKPDGYTLLFGNKGGLIHGPLTKKGVGYTLDDFAPVCNIATVRGLFYVKDESPYRTLKDFIQAAKTKSLTYCTHGAMSINHISMEYLKKLEGLQLVHIPQSGSAPCMVAGLGGHVDMSYTIAQKAMVGPGKLRPLAIPSDERDKSYPDVPTTKELGYPFFKYASAIYWLWAPKGTPKENINKIYEAFKKVVNENREEIIKIYDSIDASLIFSGPEELGKESKEEYAFTKKMFDEMGIVAK
ncbi:MAG: tripartite tricarboxylate transporter substrate binding protein [Thermodesulfobacteriota bacterium]